MVTTQENLAAVAVERFETACEKESQRRAGQPITSEQAEELAVQIGGSPEDFLEPLGIFSGIKEGVGIGRWGNGTTIFDVMNGNLFNVFERNAGHLLIYKATFPGGHYGTGIEAIGEFLFGSGSMEAALGSLRSDTLEDATLPDEEAENLLARLNKQGIDYKDYLP